MKSVTTSNEAVQKATGKLWKEWFVALEKIKARELTHKEIVHELHKNHDVSGWWAQNITVEFERFIGRREIGQTCNGDFQVTVSKTLPGSINEALETWQHLTDGMYDFDGVSFSSKPRISKTEKWRYWRVALEDGSKIAIVIGRKTEDKTLLAVNHEKLSDAEAVKRWKLYWKKFLRQL